MRINLNSNCLLFGHTFAGSGTVTRKKVHFNRFGLLLVAVSVICHLTAFHAYSKTSSTVLSSETSVTAGSASGQWSVKKANDWYKGQPWLIGCNFLPSTAVNSIEMWNKETYDPGTIDTELRWARQIGFNTIRVFIHYVVWEQDPEGLKQRMYDFLEIANSHGISVMPVLFDDCFIQDPVVGKQPGPIPGVHNSRWTASPGSKRKQKDNWPQLKKYTTDIVGHFAHSSRILAWGMYNEPKDGSLELVEQTIAWARSAQPDQPLTVGAFQTSFDNKVAQRLMEISDIVSFHSYDNIDVVKSKIDTCRKFQRPVICTEYMARSLHSRFETHLPVFKKEKIGCYNWGLVAGKIQTYMPWGSKEGDAEPKEWFHDIFRKDGTAFDLKEIALIKNTPDNVKDGKREISPTSRYKPQTWKYTFEKPTDDWYAVEYSNASWKEGKGGFGHLQTPGKIARTEWVTLDIWLRKTFELETKDWKDLGLIIQHDEDAQIYINGKLVASVKGYNAHYEYLPMDTALMALKKGKNVIAVHCKQTYGGQYIDVGIYGIKSE